MKKNEIRDAKILAFLSGRKRTGVEFLLCALSGWALTVIFEEIGWSLFAWFGLLPLLFLTYSRTWKRAALYGFVWSYFWHLGSFFWFREIEWFIPFLMAGVLASFTVFFAAFVPFFFRNLLYDQELLLKDAGHRNRMTPFSPAKEIFFSLTLAALWTVVEWARSNFFTGLPWNLLGASQWKILSLIQICEYTGIFGLSFLIAMFNVSLFTWLLTLSGVLTRDLPVIRTGFPLPVSSVSPVSSQGRLHYVRPYAFLLASAMIAGVSVWSTGRLRYYRSEQYRSSLKEVRAGVIQPSLGKLRRAPIHKTQEALAICTALSEELLREGNAEFIVWPETAVPVSINSTSENSALLRRELSRMVISGGLPFLFGVSRLEAGPENRVLIFNSAMLWKKDSPPAWYDKHHIVPFGEYVPYGDRWPVLNRIAGMGCNLSRGTRFIPLEPVPGVRFGVAICYEDIFSYVIRRQVRNGANALLTITDDSWYPTSYEPVQHFANSVFRAVETRLPFLRVGNLNCSCVIGPDGSIGSALFRDGKGRPDPAAKGRASGVLPLNVPQGYTPTFYVRYGDVFAAGCLAELLLALVIALMNFRNRKAQLLDMVSPQPEKEEKK